MIVALQTLIFFRESILTVLDRFLGQYYKKISFRSENNDDDDDSEDQVFSEFDDEKGVVFYPPMYVQRYAAVSDCLMDERWCGKLEKVVDFGYHDMSFIRYLKEVPGIKNILGVDIEAIPLRCSSDLLNSDNYAPKRENPLQITLFQGNAADPDFRLIGCDAVVAIEMIEHMMPHDLDRLVHNVFGFIKPWLAIFTTPNGDFNSLFKALEKNGLRRLDHMFEWSQEQFHDWCSNIVERYPQYTVTCKGIGPGPPGTIHLGCCSQLALFVAKDYHKQVDLNLNSLALVARVPSPNNFSDMVDGWETPDSIKDNNMLCAPNDVQSFTEFLISEKQSCMTFVISSPTFSAESLEYQDKVLQCNLDTESGKNFLMFDDEVYFNVLVPRRTLIHKVYEIEDVTCRLNCTTLQVKKFSKTTQNMMAKNRLDTLGHTREVVDEIRQLTKMLNYNKSSNQDTVGCIWQNINWGENAPYWNQFYKIVREFNYPFEVKSEESRILELISNEINRLIDNEYEGEFGLDSNKLEIPIEYLMRFVEHITEDVDKVKELLEWNGYEVVDEVVIYSRLVVDNISEGTQDVDWHENDTLSDVCVGRRVESLPDVKQYLPSIKAYIEYTAFNLIKRQDIKKILGLGKKDKLGKDKEMGSGHSYLLSKYNWDTTDARSTSVSDGTIVPDLYGRSVRRALDNKMRNLRKLLTADEDITTELDRVVCRLMKLALRTSRGRQDPPPANWMQCKLFDLLTLTEKSIERRRRHFLENFSIKAIEYGSTETKNSDALSNVNDNQTADNIVAKYQHLTHSAEESKNIDYFLNQDIFENSELGDDISVKSHKDDRSLNAEQIDYNTKGRDTKLEYVNDLCPRLKSDSDAMSSDESEYNNLDRSMTKNDTRLLKEHFGSENKDRTITRLSLNNKSSKTKLEVKHKNTSKTSKTTLVKKIIRKKSSHGHCNFLKFQAYEYSNYKVKVNRKQKEHSNLQSKSSQPIPGSLIELCDQDLILHKNEEDLRSSLNKRNPQCIDSVAATKDSLFIGIIVDGEEETIALRRTVGTDPDTDSVILENEAMLETVINVTKEDSFSWKSDTEKIQSQTIFLLDINEPSTSKGIRHLSTDVQCGPDISYNLASLSATTSLARIPKLFATGIKIGDSFTDIQAKTKSFEFGTSTDDIEWNEKKPIQNVCEIHEHIKINSRNTVDFSTMTENEEIIHFQLCKVPEYFCANVETKLIKPLSSRLKVEDSNSEISTSVSSFANIIKNSSDIQFQSPVSKEVIIKRSPVKYVRPQLSFGGIHVHSFRDKHVSEDVVYQGEWQRETPVPKAVVKKNPYKPNYKKSDLLIKKKKICLKENSLLKKTQNDDINRLRPVTVRNPKSIQLLKKSKNKLQINKKTENVTTKNIKPFRNVTKVSSKITSSINYSKNSKSLFSSKKPLLTSTPLKKEVDNHKIFNKKSYIPPYLRRRIESTIKENKKINQCMLSSDKEHDKKELNKSKLRQEKMNKLLENSNIFRDNTTYLVYRNELESDKSSNARGSTVSDVVRSNPASKRSHSPQSQNSSTCSSPNSVATVRAVSTRSKTNRKKSTSSEKSTSETVESDNTPSKNKKIFRRCKSTKKVTMSANMSENKENLSDSLRNSNPSNTNRTKKNNFVGNNKKVFMAQMAVENPTQSTSKTVSKSRAQACRNSSLKIPYIENDARRTSPTTSKIECIKDSNCYPLVDSSSNTNNMVLVLESYNENMLTKTNSTSQSSTSNHVPFLEQSNSDKLISVESELREIIEDKLQFINNDNTDINRVKSKNIVHKDKIDSNPFLGLTNSKKVILINNARTSSYSSCDASIDDSSSQNFTNARSIITDVDLLSFKSITSTMNSKFSEYFLADNELDNPATLQISLPNDSLVRDIFERKDPKIHQNIGGVLATQAFSGFSVNEEPVTGDRPDYINFVDSETGSLAIRNARQATSEELLISGRSSDTYESCFLDDESFVPNWLFNVISQQEVEESETEDIVLLPIPLPVIEPVFDINGNVMDPGVGVGAGAGDGRGMHSDQSQDSSGRGTSLSSSGTSSGPESQGIISDPSAFTSQVDYIQEPNSIPTIVVHTDSPDISFATAEAENVTFDGNGAFHNTTNRAVIVGSDIDADVSSLDTDAVDSDN